MTPQSSNHSRASRYICRTRWTCWPIHLSRCFQESGCALLSQMTHQNWVPLLPETIIHTDLEYLRRFDKLILLESLKKSLQDVWSVFGSSCLSNHNPSAIFISSDKGSPNGKACERINLIINSPFGDFCGSRGGYLVFTSGLRIGRLASMHTEGWYYCNSRAH